MTPAKKIKPGPPWYVKGQLIVTVNRDMRVCSNVVPEDGGPVRLEQQDFEDSQSFQAFAQCCQVLAFAVNYHARIYGRSLLFGVEELGVCVDFSPFARPFCSKGEALADNWLQQYLYARAKESIYEVHARMTRVSERNERALDTARDGSMEKRKKGTAMRSKKAEEGLFSSDYCFGLQCILYTVMGVAASGCPRLSLGRVDIAVNREPSMRTFELRRKTWGNY